MLSKCDARYTTMSLPPVVLECERTDLDELGRHLGGHHSYEQMDGWRRLWTWSAGGAMGTNREGAAQAEPCLLCHTPHYSVKYADVTPETDTRICFHCREWARRVEQYSSERNKTVTTHTAGAKDNVLCRPHEGFFQPNWLYCWSFTVSGAFGDRACKVIMDDGREFGPASKLWGSGEIPWWLDDKFPPNCIIDDVGHRF